jgi:hypothetical protein
MLDVRQIKHIKDGLRQAEAGEFATDAEVAAAYKRWRRTADRTSEFALCGRVHSAGGMRCAFPPYDTTIPRPPARESQGLPRVARMPWILACLLPQFRDYPQWFVATRDTFDVVEAIAKSG